MIFATVFDRLFFGKRFFCFGISTTSIRVARAAAVERRYLCLKRCWETIACARWLQVEIKDFARATVFACFWLRPRDVYSAAMLVGVEACGSDCGSSTCRIVATPIVATKQIAAFCELLHTRSAALLVAVAR